MIVHDSTGQIYELVAGHGEEAGGEEGADNSTARNGSRAVAALSDGGRNALGQPNAVIRLAVKTDDGLCVTANDTAPQCPSRAEATGP